ncbi:unnamed protein product [Acanthocheilonema viteae]|uniref:Uncharacterized protein n=1 Tax=Acanthocheilonema viteae TaxID=6277 RepID=A0A498SRF1_ACAVI|nr:unnamed protein product [Acanthocheilonema viteae]
MSDYSHSSYNRTATNNTTPQSSHKHNIPPSNPASQQQQNTRPPYSNPLMNSISSDMYGSSNSQIPYHQQTSMNSHHNSTFQLNPNAPPFHPTYSYHLNDIPSYVNAPMYDGYCPTNAYDYQNTFDINLILETGLVSFAKSWFLNTLI